MDYDTNKNPNVWDINLTIGMMEIIAQVKKREVQGLNIIQEEETPNVNKESIGFTQALQNFQRMNPVKVSKVVEQINNPFGNTSKPPQ